MNVMSLNKRKKYFFLFEVITKKPQKERNTKDSYREYLELSKYTESDNDE